MEFEVGITIATHVPVEMVDLSNACSCCASADIYGDGFNFVNMGNTFRKVNDRFSLTSNRFSLT